MAGAALLLIDLQMAFAHRDATGANRSCPEAEDNIAKLLAAFRGRKLPVIHIHHHSLEEGSPFRADLPGADAQPFVAPLDEETVITKHVNSGFIGTNLEAVLRSRDITTPIMVGATANHCVETTTRMAGNLGFNTIYVSDGVWAYDATGPDGKLHTAEDIHSMSLSNLDGEFARVLPCAEVLKLL